MSVHPYTCTYTYNHVDHEENQRYMMDKHRFYIHMQMCTAVDRLQVEMTWKNRVTQNKSVTILTKRSSQPAQKVVIMAVSHAVMRISPKVDISVSVVGFLNPLSNVNNEANSLQPRQ